MALSGHTRFFEVSFEARFGARPTRMMTAPASAVTSFSRSWELAPEGKRFLFAAPAEQAQAPFTVVLNWQAALKK